MKNIVFKYCTDENTRRYIDVLPALVDKYNNSFLRSITMKALEVAIKNKLQV